jgi:hypothetical protein
MPAELVTPPIEPPLVVKNKKSKSILALAVLGLVALSAGYFAYQNYFTSPPPPPPRPVAKKAATPAPQAPVVAPAPAQPSASVPVARSTAVVPAERKSDNSGPTPSATARRKEQPAQLRREFSQHSLDQYRAAGRRRFWRG